MHGILSNKGLNKSLRKYHTPQRRQVLLDGDEIGRDVVKDTLFKKANHVSEFGESETNK
jgi:hypothetical protein